MLKLLLFFTGFTLFLFAEELLVITDKNFKENTLTIAEIKDIFLGKKRFIDDEKILVMNHESDYPLRRCFEKQILNKSRRSLERYWRKAYYKGQHPPKIVKSIEMLLSYMEEVQPSIGYVDANDTIGENFKVVYRGVCE